LLARRIEQGRKEERGAAHLGFQLQAVQRKDDRGAMLADARGKLGDFGAAIGRSLYDDMAERLGQGNEVAFRIDDDLLHERGAFLEKTAQQVRFSRTAIALDEQARRQQFLDVDPHRGAIDSVSDDEGVGHEDCSYPRRSGGQGARSAFASGRAKACGLTRRDHALFEVT
jgi:hypothetical protein